MKAKKVMCVLISLLIFCTGVVFASNGKETTGEDKLVEKAWEITSALLWFGYAIALGMVVYIGIKYITGAADAKANMKTAIVNYLIGAFIVFAATTIASIVIGMATNANKNTDGLAGEIIDNANTAAGMND